MARPEDSHSLLPSPRVRFQPGFAGRVGRLVARWSAARQRREGAGRARLFGAGAEFVGFRPYRPGEDLRQLDWSLFARTRKPFVRVSRREAFEEWALLLDTSASMGVGRPGKLQFQAEVAAGVTAVARQLGARVTLLAGNGQTLRAGPRTPLAAVLGFLERCEARGRLEWERLADELGKARSAGRVIVLGDCLDLSPRAVLRLQRPGREVSVLQILAREELAPRASGAVEWVDCEADERLTVDVDPALVSAYDVALSETLEEWGQTLAKHRIGYAVWSSGRDFEDVFQDELVSS